MRQVGVMLTAQFCFRHHLRHRHCLVSRGGKADRAVLVGRESRRGRSVTRVRGGKSKVRVRVILGKDRSGGGHGR